MPTRFSDKEIDVFLREEKRLPADYRAKLRLKDKRGHKEQELDVQGVAGSRFRLILRQSEFNILDFSVILSLCLPTSNLIFRLRRYNGKSHEHTNVIEGETFYDFHIHAATERYQDFGPREDAYAQPTDRYADLNEALKCMFKDCGFIAARDEQASLFGEEWP